MAHWSSGQDASLSRWKLGFESRMGHHKEKHDATRRVFLYLESNGIRTPCSCLGNYTKRAVHLNFV